MTELALIAVSLLLVAGCGLFVAAEFSLIAVNRQKVRRLADAGNRRAQGADQALRTLSTQLSGAQVGITITNLAIGFLAQPAMARLLEGPLTSAGVPGNILPGLSLLIAILAATVVTMVFGEHLPKNLAIARPLKTALFSQGFQRGFSRLMRLPIKVLNGSANWLLRKMGVEPQEELASARSAEELSSLVRRSADQGTLDGETARMMQLGLSFGDLTALDVMTPRVRLRTVDIDLTLDRVLNLAARTGLSRFPVTKRSVDDVVGLIHVKQVVAHAPNKRGRIKVGDIMRPATVVPSSIGLEPLLSTLRESPDQLAVVIDEFGGTDGLVTIEDLIEELVGDVRDEHDRSRDTAMRRSDDGSWALSGLLRPDEVGRRLGLVFPEDEETETLAGLVADDLDKVPAIGDTAQFTMKDSDNNERLVRLHVERMDGRRVDRLRLYMSEPLNGEDDG